MSGTRAFRAFAAVTAGLYVVLVFWVGARMNAMMGVGCPFDLCGMFMDFDTGRGFFAKADAAVAGYYVAVVRPVDTIFPVALAVLLIWSGFRHARRVAIVLALPALAYLAADLAENAVIAQMMQAGAGLDEDLFARGKWLTILKFAALGLFLIGFAGAVRRRRAGAGI